MQYFTRYASLFLLIIVVPFLAACGDDDDGTGPSTGDPLTEAEAEGLLEVVLTGAFGVPGLSFAVSATDGSGDVTLLPMAAEVIDESFDQTVPCAQGGNVRMDGNISGNVDDNTGNGTISIDADLTHSDCRDQGSTGPLFTINGDPNIGLNADITATDETFSLTESVNGRVAWSTDDKQGSCGIDFDVTIELNQNGVTSGSVSGTVCDHDVSESF